MKEVGLYVHIPFCLSKCPYCDFNSSAVGRNPGPERERGIRDYLDALKQEMESWRGRVRGRTLFVGGGTPTLLDAEALAGVIHRAREWFSLPAGAEVSVEANPGTVDPSKLAALRAAGVTRLSLGVQSFEEQALRWLGRAHTADDARQAIRWIRAAGFQNLNLDLIFGLPGQNLSPWQATLHEALRWEPEHLAVYGLTVEEGTPLAAWVAAGRVELPTDDETAELYEYALDTLADQGYEHYEISNFARPGYRCEHNQTYWRNEEYLGFGAGAFSYLENERWGHVASPAEYVRRVKHGEGLVAECEQRNRSEQMGETMMLGLRLCEGVSTSRFQERFGCPPDAAFPEALTRLTQQRLLTFDGRNWKLTRRGLLLANQVFLAFV